MSSVICINPDRHPTATRAYAASSATSVLRSDCSGRLPQRPEVRVGSPHLKRKSEHLVYTRSDKYQHMCACMFVPGRKKKVKPSHHIRTGFIGAFGLYSKMPTPNGTFQTQKERNRGAERTFTFVMADWSTGRSWSVRCQDGK